MWWLHTCYWTIGTLRYAISFSHINTHIVQYTNQLVSLLHTDRWQMKGTSKIKLRWRCVEIRFMLVVNTSAQNHPQVSWAVLQSPPPAPTPQHKQPPNPCTVGGHAFRLVLLSLCAPHVHSNARGEYCEGWLIRPYRFSSVQCRWFLQRWTLKCALIFVMRGLCAAALHNIPLCVTVDGSFSPTLWPCPALVFSVTWVRVAVMIFLTCISLMRQHHRCIKSAQSTLFIIVPLIMPALRFTTCHRARLDVINCSVVPSSVWRIST